MNPHPKKRNRLALLCDYCRRRKVKCDRKLPCSTCIKQEVAADCEYTGDNWVPVPSSALYADKVGVFRMFPSGDNSLPSPSSNSSRTSKSSNDPSTVASFTESPASIQTRPFLPQLPSKAPAAVYGELESLKLKVSQLEANLDPMSGKPLHRAQTSHLPPITPRLQGSPYVDANLHSGTSDSSDNPTYIGINPHDVEKPDELVDLYGGYTPIHVKDRTRQMNYGPFAWLSFMKKDKALVALWSFLKVRTLTATLGPNTAEDIPKFTPVKNAAIEDYEVEFRKRALDRDGDNDVAPFRKSDDVSNSELRVQMNKNALALGLTFFEGEMSQKLQLIERIKIMLPKKKTIWLLINRFFSSIYPFIPLIDEGWFRGEIIRLLGPERYTNDRYDEIHIEARVDLATLGILLIMLRFSYLSTFSNNKESNEKAMSSLDDSSLAEFKYILTNPITIDVIYLAQLCLDQFDLLRRTNLNVLQCAVFMKVYHTFAPEDGDGSDGGDSHVFVAMCLQIAYCMGLNREPNQFLDVCNNEKVNNLSRKVWFFLKMIDMNQSFQYGFPMLVDENYNDILVPFYSPGNANVLDANLEKAVCDNIASAESLYADLRFILKRSLCIKNRMNMTELLDLVSKLELKLFKIHGTLTSYSKTSSVSYRYPFQKVMRCKAYMNVKSFTMSLFFHFFLNYEKAGKFDLAFFYLRKYLAISCGEFIPEYLEFIRNNDRIFDASNTIPDLILTPSLEFIIHKTNQLNFSILIRLNYAIAELKSNTDLHNINLSRSFEYKVRYARITQLAKMLEKFVRFGTACLSRLSSRYYYAWRVTKAHSYIINHIVSDDFYVHMMSGQKPTFMSLTGEQLNELIVIGESTLRRIKTVVQQEFRNPAESKDVTPDPMPMGEPEAVYLGSAQAPNYAAKPWEKTTPTFDLDDFLFEANSEIDELWAQLSTIKKDKRKDENGNQAEATGMDSGFANNPDFFGLNLFSPATVGAGTFDSLVEMFSTVPF